MSIEFLGGNYSMSAAPSIPYGVVRRLAYEERKKQGHPYLRVFFCNSGRRGYSGYGGLGLEVNGQIFRFTGGAKRWPQFHDGSGHLTREGEESLAIGVPGLLVSSCDWHWVCLEHNLNITDNAINQVTSYYHSLQQEQITMPMFQTCPTVPGHHNCTTIILEQIGLSTGMIHKEPRPFQAINWLQTSVGAFLTEMDQQLDDLLALQEQEVNNLLETLAKPYGHIEWRKLAKGMSPVPEWLTWSSLKSCISVLVR